MHLALCISTYQRIEYLKRMLESFLATYNQGHDWRIIITDDGSTDGTRAYLDELKISGRLPLDVVLSWRRGVHHAKNQAFKLLSESEFDVAFICDDDIWFKRYGWENLYINAMQDGPQHLIFYDPIFRPGLKADLVKRGKLESRCNAHFVQGVFFTVTPEILRAVGYMDCVNYGLAYGGHVDYSVRCMRAGFNEFDTPWDAAGSLAYIGMDANDDYTPSVEHGARAAREATPRKMDLKRKLLRDQERVFIPYNETTERWDAPAAPEPEEAPKAAPRPAKMSKSRLHLGCGTNVLDGWINIDAYVKAAGVLQEDIRKLRYPDDSMDEVLAEDVLEHFGRNEWRAVLKEWVRVLKPGGRITIRVPDMNKLCEELRGASNVEEWEKWNRRIFGDQGAEGMTHFTGFGHPHFKTMLESEFGLCYCDHHQANANITYICEKPIA